MRNQNLLLISHLMRRAGFGATTPELKEYISRGYAATLDDLLNPSESQVMPKDVVSRYHLDQSSGFARNDSSAYWLYRMVTTKTPLQEKMSLFWQRIFATGYQKLTQGKALMTQIKMFRGLGMGNFKHLLIELSKSPAMIVWLDNHDNHKDAINENYGRELLELFSMGAGNYREQDIKECARAFTGWTIANTEYMVAKCSRDSIWPYGRIGLHFEYRSDDHDNEEKEFLGQKGRFNGEDIIDIICQQPATARFIARHMYSFFVADEPPVPQWPYVPPRDQTAIDVLEKAYFDGGYDIKFMLQVLFNADFFKTRESWYQRVKGPAELVAGILRLTDEFDRPRRKIYDKSMQVKYMGQDLLGPPSVEGWHEGTEWINSGALVDRINFATEHLGDICKPGVKAMADRVVAAHNTDFSPEQFVDDCLDEMGGIDVSFETRKNLTFMALRGTSSSSSDMTVDEQMRNTAVEVFRIIASTREFQRV